jgi:hypothetical protein
VAALAAPGSATGAPAVEATGPGVPPARDGNVAIRQELDAARQAGTPAAYDLFIARHPTHPLAATARRERDRLPAAGR